MTSLVQLKNLAGDRFVALVENDALRLLTGVESAYALCQSALATGRSLIAAARTAASAELIAYDAAYHGHEHGHEWRILPAFDHPAEPARCLVTRIGLTHRASVDNRNAMRQENTALTDSMRMYQLGVEGGAPEPGSIGVSPEL